MKIETKYDIASSVNIGAEYDKGVKKLFKSKEIIVPIMEMVIPEFEGCSQEEILNCLDLASITSDEVVSDAPVSETDEYRIRGEDTELSGGSDKLIRFDSKFRIRNPKLSEENILVNLHIDLEGQKSYTPKNPTYPIIKRGLYYVARDLSSQLGVATGKTNYADLEKCYSIWICLEDIPVRLRNTMTEYRIRKEDVLGETDEPEEDYDLMSVIVIRMGEKSEERWIFDYLNQVFVGNIEEIETYSHIEWEDEFKEDVAMTMTGFSDILVRRGREEGRKEGREEGRIEGREIGQEETTVKFIWSLHEMKCTDDMISEAVKRPIDYVQDILKKDAPQ